MTGPAILRKLFFYQDIYHAEQYRRQDGEVGYSPSCRNRFSEACKAQGYRCDTCAHRDLAPLTDDLLERHLAGKITLGAYQLRADGTAAWLCLDVDANKPDEYSLEQARALTRLLLAKATRMGLPTVCEDTGNKGYHIWIFVPEGASAALLRSLGDLLVDETLNEEGEFAGVHVEIFPKQTQLQNGEFGNLVKIPLGIHKKTGRRCQIVDNELEPVAETIEGQAAYLAQAITMTPQEITEITAEWGSSPVAPQPGNGEHKLIIKRTEPSPLARKTTDFMTRGAPTGERNDRLFRAAADLAGNGYPRDLATRLLADPAKQSGMEADEIERTIESAYSKERWPSVPPAEQRRVHLTDLGNAQRLIRTYGQNLRFCALLGGWFVWTGQKWERDITGQVQRMAQEVARSIYAEAREETDPEERTKIAKHAIASEAASRQRALLDLAWSQEGIAVAPEAWDADLWLLNCENGTVDLRTGELTPHRREDMITKLAPVVYDPDAEAPLWEAHLAMFILDMQVRRQVQRDLGVALVGETLDEVLSIWHGTGANGKSTTSQTLQRILGDYAQSAAPNLLVESKHENHPTEIADLRGARLVFSVEIGDNKNLDEAKVKLLTGGDTKKARLMRQDFFEFPQTFSIAMLVNHLPNISGTDDGIWRRIRLIPWTVRIAERDRKPQASVITSLVAEGPGILRWLLRGLADWQSDPHWTADAVTEATSSYKDEQDRIGAFLLDSCQIGPTYSVLVGDLYETYASWCEDTDQEPVGKTDMGRLLKQRGIRQKRTEKGARRWIGLRLLSSIHVQVTKGDKVSESPAIETPSREFGKTRHLLSPNDEVVDDDDDADYAALVAADKLPF